MFTVAVRQIRKKAGGLCSTENAPIPENLLAVNIRGRRGRKRDFRLVFKPQHKGKGLVFEEIVEHKRILIQFFKQRAGLLVLGDKLYRTAIISAEDLL